MKRYAFLILATGSFAASALAAPPAPAKPAAPAASPAKPAAAAPAATPAAPTPPAKASEVIKTDVIVGSGAEATSGKTVSVHYTGWLYDAAAPGNRGLQIDNSIARGKPFEFTLGKGQAMKGWDEGIDGMKVGGRRTLLIPGLAYGTRSAGGVTIPPNTALLFDIDLLNVR